jgi:hypothetical protein
VYIQDEDLSAPVMKKETLEDESVWEKKGQNESWVLLVDPTRDERDHQEKVHNMCK